MSDLTERQRLVLALVIRDYIERGKPVGSPYLVEKLKLDYSPATIRNELLELTDLGYLRVPHTSAGRVPTEEGYRYFVRQLMGQTELPATTQRTIAHQFFQAGPDVNSWMRLAASVLAQQSQSAAVVTAPHSDRTFFKHIELIGTIGRQVLMVLVLEGGEVRQQMLALGEPVTQEQLSSAAQHLNQLFQGMHADQVAALAEQLTTLEKDIVRLVSEELHRSGDFLMGDVYRDGISYALTEPAFGEVENARRALRILEERPLLEDLLSRTVLSSDAEGVQVLIGGEGTWEELSDCSIVLARYGVPGIATGTLGVLGPIRMSYGRNISTVRFMAGLLSELVNEMLEK